MKVEQPIRTREQNVEEVIAKVKEVLENNYYEKKEDGSYGYEVYCDYNDELGDEELADISQSECPRETFNEIMAESADYSWQYYFPELLKKVRAELENYDEYEDEIDDWLRDNVYYYMPYEHFNEDVDVVISLDVGDCNYDFTRCNILNYYGTDGGYGENGNIPDNSPIKWLAKQQGKLTELRKAVKDSYNGKSVSQYSAFSKSVVKELVNSPSHMNTLVFLVSMPLFDFIKLREIFLADEPLNKSYYYEERKGEHTFTVSKRAVCGLYDLWYGGGSILEIELEKDVVIPTKAVFDMWIESRGCKCNGRGYDLCEVYGLWRGAFDKGSVDIA